MKAIPLCISIACLYCGPTSAAFALEGHTASNLPKIIQLGESAYQKGDLRTAREAYREAIEIGGKSAPSPRNYFDRSLRLAEIEYALGGHKTAYHILTDLSRDTDIPSDLYIKVEVFRAKLLAETKRAGPAFVLLTKAQEKTPLENWEKTDKAYFMSLEFILEEHYADVLAKAERFSISGLYDQARPLFETVWKDIEAGYFPKALVLEGKDLLDKVRYLYAEAIYHTASPKTAISILGPTLREIIEDPKYGTATDLNMLYLASLCYRQLGDSDQVLETLEAYKTMSSGSRSDVHFHEVNWELGVAYYERDRLEESEELFRALRTDAPNEKLYISSEMYLARINLKRNEHYEANQRLRKLSKRISASDPLKYELAYLLGEIAFQKEQYENALTFFEKAVPAKNTEQATWYPALLKKQAFSNLRLAKSLSDIEAKEAHFHRSEKLLKRLIEVHGEVEEGILELCRSYLTHARELNRPDYYTRVEKLLSNSNLKFSPEQEGQSLLLRAEASDSYAQRESLFHTIFEETRFEGTEVRKHAFFYQGVNNMMRAREEIPAEAKTFWEKANRFFTFAIEELSPSDTDFYSQAIKLRAETRYQLGSRAYLTSALQDLQMLFANDAELAKHVPDVGELYHLQGLTSAKLYAAKSTPNLLELAKKSLEKVSSSYPQASYAAEALYTLAALNYQSGHYKDAYSNFNKYIRFYSKENDIDYALFWAAESAESLGMTPQIIREVRNRLFDRYPNSALAPLAYLKYYSFAEYLNGDEAAITHLKNMYRSFPSSPYIVTSFYLLGLYEKKEYLKNKENNHLNEALGFFQSAQDSYDHFQSSNAIPADYFYQITNIRYQAQLERAITFLLIAEDTQMPEKKRFEASVQGQKVLKSIMADFGNHQNVVTQALIQHNPYPKTLEVAEYTLGQSFLKEKRAPEARKVFAQMLEHYQEANQNSGYYLSRALYELGLLKMEQSKWEPALYYFNKSTESAGKGILSEEQKLQTLINRSLCLKELKDHSGALEALNSVIETEYPSDIKTQAMVLKAEILEQTGDREQAQRILKASSKGTSEWSLRAKSKLKEYGFN